MKNELLQDGIGNLDLPETPKGLYEPIRYILEDGGKRIRPMLLLLTASSLGMDPSKCVNQAMAVEVFHNFTLLHDDIMDKAPIRRGRPTVHCKWNDNTAILSGDAMVILAYKLLIRDLNSEALADVISIFNKAALEVCEGQQFDMDFETRSEVTIDEYLEMIRLKTAVLLGAAVSIGARMAKASDSDCRALYRFGESLGMAFQIQDDLLDTYGDSSLFGKKIGGDIAEGKKTFLLLSALQKADNNQKEVLTRSHDYATVRKIYDMLDVKSVAEKRIDSYYATAMNELSVVSCPSEELRRFAESMIRRIK